MCWRKCILFTFTRRPLKFELESVGSFCFRTRWTHFKASRHRTSTLGGCRTLINPFIISSSFVGACLYLLLQKKKHLCKELGRENFVNGKYVDVDYVDVVAHCRDLLQRLKDEVGAPGVVVGVSVDGEVKWEEGLGYADIENRVPCTKDTVMRIASISKSITMTAVAKLWEEGKLDLDKPVQHYVPEFPRKTYNGEPVEITCRQLVSHMAGIRHYGKKSDSKEGLKSESGEKALRDQSCESKGNEKAKSIGEFDHKEYYIKDKFADVQAALQLFKDDELIAKPGSSFKYTTHGWTLISAVVEKASKEPFTVHITKLFKKLGMFHTYLDVNDSLIYHRSRNYIKDKRGLLINAPYVDNSYKWAGGGFLSTVGDLLKFANAMLYSLQFEEPKGADEVLNSSVSANTELDPVNMGDIALQDLASGNSKQKCVPATSNRLRGYLLPSTVKAMWYPVAKPKDKDWMYAMGWFVLPDKQDCEYCQVQRLCISHTGGAVGASSILLVLPEKCCIKNSLECECPVPPKGIVVAIFANMQEIDLRKVAQEIADAFDKHRSRLHI